MNIKRIVWCVIGAGGIADRRGIPALLSDPNNEVVAVMDCVIDVAETVAKKYRIPAFYDDAEEMLKSTKFNAVYIATPVFCHYERAILYLLTLGLFGFGVLIDFFRILFRKA